MAIIRNDRSSRQEPEPRQEEEEVEEIDYSWHPSEEEFASPITPEQWTELLSDPVFAETDAAKAVRCLREYGEPATFQQLSIRYRGTMGRYRRWLSEAAQEAGNRYDVPAPQQDQFGMDEWWPLLYRIRNTGKPGAGVFEMMLRPEVDEAFLQIEEQERQAKRAENARNLKRIEQLERARQEERRRRAEATAAASRPAPQPEPEPEPAQAPVPAPRPEPAPQDPPRAQPAPTPVAQAPEPQPAAPQSPAPQPAASQGEPAPDVAVGKGEAAGGADQPVDERDLPALRAFLEAMAKESEGPTGARFVSSDVESPDEALDAAAPVDYALRYAERLRHAIGLIRRGMPRASAASVARELGNESVEELQGILNGQAIPTFAYLDNLQSRLFVNLERLEVADGLEDGLPAFCSLAEAWDADDVVRALLSDELREVAYVVDDSDERRTGVVVRFSELRCALLTRDVVLAGVARSKNPALGAFVRMVDELDDLARTRHVLRTSRQVGSQDWDTLFAGRMWPATLLARTPVS